MSIYGAPISAYKISYQFQTFPRTYFFRWLRRCMNSKFCQVTRISINNYQVAIACAKSENNVQDSKSLPTSSRSGELVRKYSNFLTLVITSYMYVHLSPACVTTSIKSLSKTYLLPGSITQGCGKLLGELTC